MIALDLMQAIKLSSVTTDKDWGERLIRDAAKREIENGYTQQRLAVAILKAKGKKLGAP